MTAHGSNIGRENALFIGDLSPSTEKGHIIRYVLDKLGPDVQVDAKVCMDHNPPHLSLRHGYINFARREDADKFLTHYNYSKIYPDDKVCRLMWSQPDVTARKSPTANICVKNLPSNFENKSLHELFNDIGTILSCRVSEFNKKADRPTHGFVQFETKEMAQKAIDKMNKTTVDKHEIIVEWARLPEQHVPATCFISQFDSTVTEDDLIEFVKPVDEAKKALVIKDKTGISRQIGFIVLSSKEKAQECVAKCHGTNLKGTPVKVTLALTKWGRLNYRKQLREATRFRNLYVRGFPTDYKDSDLRALFESFGKIQSCTIMKSDEGISRGYGFCCFERDEDARKAFIALNDDKRSATLANLVVNYAQSRNERELAMGQSIIRRPFNSFYGRPFLADMASGVPRAELLQPTSFLSSQVMPQAMHTRRQLGAEMASAFAQFPMGPFGMARDGSRGPSRVPTQMYPPGPQNVMTPLPRGGAMPPQAIFPGSHQQRGPYVQYPYYQTPPGHGMGTPTSGIQAGTPQSQMGPATGQSPSNGGASSTSSTPSMTPMTPTSNVSTPTQTPQPSAIDQGRLSVMTPEDQKQFIGEHLYPAIQALDPRNAGKITGMLLELEIEELLRLNIDREALRQKVVEAQTVLRDANQL